MKKIIFLAAAIVSLVSCTRTQEVDIPDNRLTLLAKTETSADTRTVVEGETHVYWEPGDEIAVFSREHSGKFVTDLTSSSPTASFTGTLGEDGWEQGQDLWAVYPYSEKATFDGDTITTTLPSVQYARADSFGKDVNVAVAHSTTGTLQFYNVGGGVRFTVTESGVQKIVFESLGGELLSGDVKIALDENGIPQVQKVTKGSMFITLLPPSGQTSFQTNTWYYIVAIPGSLESGYKLRFEKVIYHAKKVSEKSITIRRSVYGSIENADSEMEYERIMPDYPRTDATWAAVEERLLEINPIIQSILNRIERDENYSQIVADEVLNIEGVSSSVPSEDGALIHIKFKNGIYANIYLGNFEDTFGGGLSSPSSASDGLNALESPETLTTPTGKKALVLIPVYNEVTAYLGNHAVDLYNTINTSFTQCGYEVTCYANEEATAEKFAGDVLEKYHAIYINTHGTNNALLPDGTKGTTLKTMTPVGVNPRTGAIVFQKNDIPRRWISVKYIKSKTPRFKNSWFFLHACNSITRNDLYQYLLNRGAASCSGFITEASKRSSVDFASDMISAMTAGMEVQAATDWAITHSTNQYGELWDPRINLDLFVTHKSEGVESFYLFNPWPYDIQHTICNNTVILSWKIPPHSNSYTSRVYVNGSMVAKIEDTGENEYNYVYTANGPGNYSWYVRTTLELKGENAVTYQSEEDPFVVRPYGNYPTPEAIDLGLSVKWAGFNLGATKPEECGDYYAWGEVEPYYTSLEPLVWKPGKGDGYTWTSYRWSKGSAYDLTKYCLFSSQGYQGFTDGKTSLDPTDDAAIVQLGDKWRMPTLEECIELNLNCTWKSATINDVEGCIVTGPNGNSIFIPSGPHWKKTSMEPASYYWASDLSSDTSYFGTGFTVSLTYSTNHSRATNLSRDYGGFIRPVYDE